jgi:CheY-like chemotaxis protein
VLSFITAGERFAEDVVAVKRALTIDEDVEIRRNLRYGLMAAGWQVEEAASGLAGLDEIRHHNAEGAGFNCIISAAILPDLDSKLFLRALRAQYPALPLVVLTAYPEAGDREALLQLVNLAYLEKPVELPALLGELARFDLSASTIDAAPAPCPSSAPRHNAYAYLRFISRGQAAELYGLLGALPGVSFTNAVKGDYDMVLRLTAATAEELNGYCEGVKQAAGVSAVIDKLERPRIGPEIETLLQHYEAVAGADREAYLAHHPTNAYLLIDIDRYQLERIYASLSLTEGVISCEVAANGAKLVVLMSGAVRPEVVRHVLRKIAVMDGIRRVREAPVINIAE